MKFTELTNTSLKELFLTYKANRKTTNIIFFSLLALLVIFLIISPYQYLADASIMPPKQQSNQMNMGAMLQNLNLGAMSGGLGSLQQSNLSLFYGEVLKSKSVANYIIDTLKLRKSQFFKQYKEGQLQEIIIQSLDILVDRSGVIYLSAYVWTDFFPNAEDKDSAAILSSKIANTAIQALDYIIRQRANNISSKTKDFIAGEIQIYLKKLDSVQNSLEVFQSNKKVLELEEQTKAIVAQANELSVELAKAEVELNMAKKLYSENAQSLKVLQENYNTLRSQFNKIQTGGLTGEDQFSIPLKDIPNLIRQYTNLIREQKLYEQILAYLRTTYYQEAISEKKDVPQVDVLDWAVKPYKKNAPTYSLAIIIGLIIDLFVVFIFVMFKHSKSRPINA